MTTRRRLVTELVRRGSAASVEEAERLVREGNVHVSGLAVTNPATMVGADEPLQVRGSQVRGSPEPYVSRGGRKLAAALERFDVDPTGRSCLDAGSSTGGFTDCLLRHRAAHVVAVDVGYGQLDWSLRNDDRVTVLERTNVRNLEAAELPYAPDLMVADLSFISLRAAIPALTAVSAREAEMILLVKPQFEASRDRARGGVVRDPEVWREVIAKVADDATAAGWGLEDVMASPLRGPAGNVEFLLQLSRDAGPSGRVPTLGLAVAQVDAAIAEGRALIA